MKQFAIPAPLHLAVVLLAVGCAVERPAERGLSPEERERALQSFDQVWTTVHDRHWDASYNGVDWNAVRDELRPKVEGARSQAEVRAILAQLVSRLGQTHFAILPNAVYSQMEAPGGENRASAVEFGSGVTGMRVRAHARRALVVRVDPGSPAERAGISAGSSVLRVGDTNVEKLMQDLAKSYGDVPLAPAMMALTIEGLLSGPVGREVRVELADPAGVKQTVSVGRELPRGRPATFGHLPTMYVDFEARELEGGIGYIKFDGFLDPAWLMPKFGEAVEQFLDAPGIILDLRGNPGGIGAMAMGIGGWFVDEDDLHLGTMRTKETELNFVLNPRPRTYGGPLAVLVDVLSMSTAEILAGGLQDLGRARVFGTRTAGAALPSIIERLPNGDGFQYAFAHYRSAGGQVLEGHGVIPDVAVEPDPSVLVLGRDPVVEAALAWIREEGRAATAELDYRGASDIGTIEVSAKENSP